MERLAVISGRPAAHVQFVLPNLHPHRLLPAEGGLVWDWPWDTAGCFLVRVCELCARAKVTSLNAYLASDATWQVCARHGCWLDNRREPGTADIPLAGVPKVVSAHRQRLLLERRLGAGGRAMFADAYAIPRAGGTSPPSTRRYGRPADAHWDVPGTTNCVRRRWCSIPRQSVSRRRSLRESGSVCAIP